MKNISTQPYKGTRDFFPGEMRKLRYIFSVWRKVCERFGYEEYLGPILEPWDLYAAKNVSGEEIVDKQLYWFEDRGGRKVAIRPEMTPTVARMIAARSKQLPKPIRWFSIANFMRYEKPQKGRTREFFQLNVDIFGEDTIAAEAELIEIAVSIMREFGADENMFQIKVNNRKFVDSYLLNNAQVPADKVNSVMRVLDRFAKQKEEETKTQLEEIGLKSAQIDSVLKLSSFEVIDLVQMQDDAAGVDELLKLFDLLGERDLMTFINFDALLMRGLDYYTGNIFEQFDLKPQNKRSMFGGGRYDGLSKIFGQEELSASGFAPGDVTTLDFLNGWNLLPDLGVGVDVLVTVFSQELRRHAWQAADALRQADIRTELYTQPEDAISQQLSYANKRDIPHVVIIGPGEIDMERVVWKNMITGEQTVIAVRDLIDVFKEKALL